MNEKMGLIFKLYKKGDQLYIYTNWKWLFILSWIPSTYAYILLKKISKWNESREDVEDQYITDYALRKAIQMFYYIVVDKI